MVFASSMFQTPRSPPILSSFIDHTIRIKRWDFPISVKHVYLKTVIKLSDIKFFGIQVTWQIRTIVSLDIYKNKNRRIDIHSLLATNSILNSLFYIVVLRSMLRINTLRINSEKNIRETTKSTDRLGIDFVDRYDPTITT